MEESATSIALRGELDLANSATLEAELLAALGEKSTKVVLDMSNLEFIDSTGIAVLVRALSHETAGERLRFIPTESGAVARILKLTGVDRQLPVLEPASE